MQVTAFPQDGIFARDGDEERLENALELGVDCVGGIPHYEPTSELGLKEVHRVFELAKQYSRRIDVHCDETDDPSSRFLEVMADDTVKFGLGGRVTASHCTAMGSYEPYYSSKLHGFLRRAGINIVVNPFANSLIQGRLDVYPKRRGFAQLKELLAAGVNVSLGNDVIMDPWYLLGRADMVEAASLALHFTYMSGLEEIPEMLRCATERGARTLGVEDEYGIEAGKPADLVVYDAPSALEVLRLHRAAALGDPPRPRRRGDDACADDAARRARHVRAAGMTVGLLHPGEMGAAIGAALQAAGHEVLWASDGRSDGDAGARAHVHRRRHRRRARRAQRCRLLRRPAPRRARARRVACRRFSGIYVDANAVSPATAARVGATVERFVDGGIVGGPPAPRLYLSGAEAPAVAELFEGSAIETLVVANASALKCAYAGWTKGSGALLLAIREFARAEGVWEPLAEEWERSQPRLAERARGGGALRRREGLALDRRDGGDRGRIRCRRTAARLSRSGGRRLPR